MRSRFVALLSVLCAPLLLVLPVTPAAATHIPQAVTAGALPTPQTNGIVFAIEIVGDTAYVGGRFSRARPAGAAPGENEVVRKNLLAFNVRTGQLLSWAPTVSGTEFTSATDPGPYCRKTGEDRYVCDSVFRIKASPGKTALYVGGDFDRIDGNWRTRIAKFAVSSGALTAFAPRLNGRVRGLSITSDTVYVGGSFTSANGSSRGRLAAFRTDGTLLPWGPKADRSVYAVLAAPEHDRVVVGGAFTTLNGIDRQSIGAVSANAGANVAWSAGVAGAPVVTDIAKDSAGTAYISGYAYHDGVGKLRFEGRMAADIATGKPKWRDGCLGDTQAIAVVGKVLYSVSHNHDCWAINAIREGYSDFKHFRLNAETTDAVTTAVRDYGAVSKGDPVPVMLPWFPNTNGGPSDSAWHNGTWAIAANSEFVVAGGEFTRVNGVPQQSLTRFAARGVAGAKNFGPQKPFAAPTLTKNSDGRVVVTWRTTWDAQNSKLTYRVMRKGSDTPRYTITKTSRPWNRPRVSFTDSARQGTYWIRATDADGVTISTPQKTIS